jgi:hypothetical protein
MHLRLEVRGGLAALFAIVALVVGSGPAAAADRSSTGSGSGEGAVFSETYCCAYVIDGVGVAVIGGHIYGPFAAVFAYDAYNYKVAALDVSGGPGPGVLPYLSCIGPGTFTYSSITPYISPGETITFRGALICDDHMGHRATGRLVAVWTSLLGTPWLLASWTLG